MRDFSEVDDAFFNVTDAFVLGLMIVFFGGDIFFIGVSLGGGGVSGLSGLNILFFFLLRSISADWTCSLAGVLDLELRLASDFLGEVRMFFCELILGTGVTVAEDFGLAIGLRAEDDFCGLELSSDSESEYTLFLLITGILRGFVSSGGFLTF